MKIFARNFRGFKNLRVDLEKNIFLIGDNSSGKSSIIYLIEAVTSGRLNMPPTLDEHFGVSRYDYFSPYFDMADVTFGFMIENNSRPSNAKIITVKKSDEPLPKLMRCTYWIPGFSVRLRRSGSKARVSIDEAPHSMDEAELLRLHNSPGNFKRNDSIDVTEIADPQSLFYMDFEGETFSKLRSAMFGQSLRQCRVTSPVRALPERFYENRRKFDAHGLHFARVWLDIFENNPEIFEYIDEFGRESGLFEKLHVDPVSKVIEDPPLFVSVVRNQRRFSLNQVGVGVSQIVPVMMDSLFSLKFDGRQMLVQQPELHLHPVAQAALGTYFYHMCRLGLRCVFETHSSFFVDRFRSELRGQKQSSAPGSADDPFSEIIFCEAKNRGNVAHRVLINNDGTLSGEPKSYHQFFLDELLRTMF
ncbi:MAG: AAA family ATPase [Erythrobacter sp.]|jgi:hypothetical protein|nr:AAA family ATPase [Erythrobacter sp.]